MTETLPVPKGPYSDALIVAPGEEPGILADLRAVTHPKAVVDRQVERYAKITNPTAHEQQVHRVFKALQEERTVIDLNVTLTRSVVEMFSEDRQSTGRHYSNALAGYRAPTLAIGRPGDKVTWVRIYRTGLIDYYNHRPRHFLRWTSNPNYTVNGTAGYGNHWSTARCAVPELPREVAERFPDSLRRNTGDLLIWEASWESWDTHTPRPPIQFDPALLGHLGGTLYVVKAAWELTFVEAAALGFPPSF